MDATLRVMAHQQDVSAGKKEGVIEQQEDNMEAVFEMLNTLPVVDEEVFASESAEIAEYQMLDPQATSEHGHWPAGMEIAATAMDATADTAPKSTQQVVEELSAASTRKLTASPMGASNAQLATFDSAKAIADGVTIKSETPSLNGALTNIQSMTHRANTTFPTLQNAELMTAALTDGQASNSALTNANAAPPGTSVKALEWAKVDLTATINNQHNKSILASQIGEKLNAILQDKINIQAANGIKSAQIRLDPPDMGHIKLIVSIEGDKVSVGMSAQNSIVREGLMQVSERLRHDLVNENFTNVAINIDAESDSRSAEDEHQEQEPEVIANNFFAEQEVQLAPQGEFIVKI